MAVFTDALGSEWRIEFDAFSLEDVKTQTGVDLADLAAGGYQQISTDAGKLGRVVCVLCADELASRRIDKKELSKRIRKDAIGRARKAVADAAADFFPASEWSEIQSNLAKIKADPLNSMDAAALANIIPLMQAFQSLPESVQIQLIQEERAAITSGKSEAKQSATAPEIIPLEPAIDSQESAEQPQED